MKADLMQVHEMIKQNKAFEKRQSYERIIEWSRLPKVIKVRYGLRTRTYRLEYGDIDDRVYIGYSDENVTYKQAHKVLMHYEESTLHECISKAWRNLAENHIKVA